VTYVSILTQSHQACTIAAVNQGTERGNSYW
jgi:hypothetical protein